MRCSRGASLASQLLQAFRGSVGFSSLGDADNLEDVVVGHDQRLPQGADDLDLIALRPGEVRVEHSGREAREPEQVKSQGAQPQSKSVRKFISG